MRIIDPRKLRGSIFKCNFKIIYHISRIRMVCRLLTRLRPPNENHCGLLYKHVFLNGQVLELFGYCFVYKISCASRPPQGCGRFETCSHMPKQHFQPPGALWHADKPSERIKISLDPSNQPMVSTRKKFQNSLILDH